MKKKFDNFYLLFILVFFLYFIGNLYLIFSNYLDGGQGDSTHRILFTYDFLNYSLKDYIHHHLVSPWPPLPFIMQGIFYKFLKIFSFQLMSSIYILSLILASIHLIIIFKIFKKFQKSILGLIYIICFVTSGSLNEVLISSMSEIYALFFLSFGLLFIDKKINFFSIIILGLIFFLATLCRSETIFISSSLFFLFFLFLKKKIFSLLFLLISASPIIVKNIYYFFHDINPDSNSITMGALYNFGNLYERAYNFAGTILSFINWQNLIVIILILFLFITLEVKNNKIRTLKKKDTAILFLGITYLILILLTMFFGPITQNLRYLFIPSLIIFIGFLLILKKKANSDCYKILNKKIYLFYFITFVGLFLNFYFLTKSIPKEIRYAKNFLLSEIQNNKIDINRHSVLLIDSLLGHEMYFMMHAITHSNYNYAASQFDMRPQPYLDPSVEFLLNNNTNSAIELKMLSYIHEFKPMYLVTARGSLRNEIESLVFTINKHERSTYIFTNSKFDKGGDLELNLKKINKDKKIYYKKIFENNLLNIFKFISD